METIGIEAFSKLLQMCMVPAILISSVGLLLLSITNRLGRAVDRSRDVVLEYETATDRKKESAKAQLPILLKRSGILRTSAMFVGGSILFSSLMILELIFMQFVGLGTQKMVMILFLSSVLCMTLSVVFFILDISLTLKALRLEVHPYL